jgi:hypothetical protein
MNDFKFADAFLRFEERNSEPFDRVTENDYVGLHDGSVFCFRRLKRLRAHDYAAEHSVDYFAHAVSRITRWNGAIPVSLLTHVMCVSNLAGVRAAQSGFDKDTVMLAKYIGLHHDDHEAYISDFARPVKRFFPALKDIERYVEEPVIANNFRLCTPKNKTLRADACARANTIVKQADFDINMLEGLLFLPGFVLPAGTSLNIDESRWSCELRQPCVPDDYIMKHVDLAIDIFNNRSLHD